MKHFVGIVGSAKEVTIGQKVNRLSGHVFAFPLVNQFPALVNQKGAGGVKRGKQHITGSGACGLGKQTQSALCLCKNEEKKGKNKKGFFHGGQIKSDLVGLKNRIRNGVHGWL